MGTTSEASDSNLALSLESKVAVQQDRESDVTGSLSIGVAIQLPGLHGKKPWRYIGFHRRSLTHDFVGG